MAFLQISQKVNRLFEDIPEFNSGNIHYDSILLSNTNFGGASDQQILNSTTYDFITSLSLSITLPALTNTDHIAQGGGYISWVNNIGHSIISGIELVLNSETIFDFSFPYDKWLDIHNELNDVESNEKVGLQKYDSNGSRAIYNNQQIILNVPLHFWMSDFTKNAFPFFLIDDGQIKFRVKFKRLPELVYFSPIGNAANINQAIQPTVRLNVGSYKINDSSLKSKLKSQTYSVYFNYYTYTMLNVASNNSISSSQSNPLKQIEFIVITTNRDTVKSDFNSVSLINTSETDDNNNDYLNYGAINTNIVSGEYESFNQMNLLINNTKYYLNDLSSCLVRRTLSLEHNARTPKKFVYPLAFTPKPYSGELFGCLDLEYVDTININFSNVQANSRMYVFFTHLRKMTIKSNIITFDEWGTTDVNFRSTGFKFSDTEILAQTTSTADDESAQETSAEIQNLRYIGKEDNTYSSFMILAHQEQSGNFYVDVVLGDNITPVLIKTISDNLRSGSLSIIGDDNNIQELVDLNFDSSYLRKIPDYIRLNLKKKAYDLITLDPKTPVEDLFEFIQPFSKGFYISINNQMMRFDYWITNDTFEKKTTEINSYIDSLYVKNESFNNRIYTFQINKIINIVKKPYTYNLEYMLPKLFGNTIQYFKWNNIKPDIQHFYLIPTDLHPSISFDLMSDLSRDYIRELFGIRFDVKNSYSITFDQIRDYVQKSYTTQLKYIFDYTKQNQSSDYFYNIRKRLEIANNYSKGEINNRYPNIVSLFETTNMDIFIRGRGKTSIDTLNEDITNKTLSHIEVKGTEQILEFVFL